MYGTGYYIDEVIEKTGLSKSDIAKICKKYQKDGINGLYNKPVQRNKSFLSIAQITELRSFLRTHTPFMLWGFASYSGKGSHWTVEDLKTLLKERYQTQYARHSAYHRIFSQCGFVYYWKVSGYLDIETVFELESQ